MLCAPTLCLWIGFVAADVYGVQINWRFGLRGLVSMEFGVEGLGVRLSAAHILRWKAGEDGLESYLSGYFGGGLGLRF